MSSNISSSVATARSASSTGSVSPSTPTPVNPSSIACRRAATFVCSVSCEAIEASMPSSLSSSASTERRTLPSPSFSSASRWTATAEALGWSNTSVAGRRSPVAVFRRLRNSTAASESKPRSLNARCASIASGEACPSTAAT